ncbi:hypothetical protein [Micromonospora sp. NBC_01813]|uniref:hypothetical protein n=1 Tax=Micromonospora sp. NBC_01813 TaxID=2975988 RepID=UPI002DDA7F04|nr:hypothetical protein [Micromonospora sp. NBC_01813]WSA08698.1 hypothetical protein OG958_31765 [Micromonospora sp. NBC_01813]
MPRRDFATTYGSILSLRHGRHRIYLAAVPANPGRLGGSPEQLATIAARRPIALTLAAATATGRWRPFGRIDVGDPLPDAVDAALAFDPTGNPPLRLRPGGLIQRLRTVTYAPPGAPEAPAPTPSTSPTLSASPAAIRLPCPRGGV